VRIATRASAQATAQATDVGEQIATAMAAAGTPVEVELVLIDTLGDRRQDVPLHTIGGQGVFVKEVQRAVLVGEADLAVHSAKDLPSAPTEGLVLGALCQRRDPSDALVGCNLADLAAGATVATGSVRRRAQLAQLRPDLHFVELRGNIHTRLDKVPVVDGVQGAIVIAVAALEIVGLTDRIAQVLPADTFVPSPGQGCVAVECRIGHEWAMAACAAVDHAATRACVEAERAFLAELGSGCSLPVGAYADGGTITGFLAADDGVRPQRTLTHTVPLGDDVAEWPTVAAHLAAAMRAELTGD
jgi:hydroxymethylbilane synthase